jgi:hypothetical protein
MPPRGDSARQRTPLLVQGTEHLAERAHGCLALRHDHRGPKRGNSLDHRIGGRLDLGHVPAACYGIGGAHDVARSSGVAHAVGILHVLQQSHSRIAKLH